MKLKVLLLTITILIGASLFAQKQAYTISLKEAPIKNAKKYYSKKVSEIITYEVNNNKSSELKAYFEQLILNKKTINHNIIATFWLNTNGTINSSLFGSSIKRNTPPFKELNDIYSRIRVSPLEIKKIITSLKGEQIHQRFSLKKVTDSVTQQSKIILSNYEFLVRTSKIYKAGKADKTEKAPKKVKPIYASLIYKGCRISKKIEPSSKEGYKKLRACLASKINELILKKSNVKQFKNNLLLKGKKINTYNILRFNKDGVIEEVNSISLVPEYENEAKRIFLLIPKAIPATKNGEPINYSFSKIISTTLD